MDSQIDSIISWYVHRNPWDWFKTPPGMDDEMRSKFGENIQQARRNEFDDWAETPKGALALILLLDQFPRNVFRDSGESYSSDAKARSVAVTAIAKKFDRELGKENKYYQYFFYLPLMHAEDLCSQVACLSMLEGLVASCDTGTEEKEFFSSGMGFAQRHVDCILEVGRFPKRNEPIGRETTHEEKKFLEKHPDGF